MNFIAVIVLFLWVHCPFTYIVLAQTSALVQKTTPATVFLLEECSPLRFCQEFYPLTFLPTFELYLRYGSPEACGTFHELTRGFRVQQNKVFIS